MKKNHKIYDIKDFEVKLCSTLMAGAILTTAIKLYDYSKSDGEINIIKDETDSSETFTPETFKEASRNTNNYPYEEIDPVSDEYYRSIVIQGRTVNFVNTPTPTPIPIYDAYTDEQILGEDGVKPEGYDEYKDRKDHSLNFKTIDEMISFYSKVFELNEEVTSKIIYDMLGDKDYPLEGEVEINGTTYSFLENAIALIIFDLYKHPDNYGYSYDDIKSTEGYQLDYHFPEELLYKVCHVLEVDEYIAAAIMYAECGRKHDSYLFIYYYNYGGIVGNNGFAKYLNEADGAFEFVYKLKYQFYVGIIPEEEEDKKLRSMSYTYCELSDNWYSLTKSIKNELRTYGYGSTYYTYNYQDRDLIYCDEEEESFYRSRYYNG